MIGLIVFFCLIGILGVDNPASQQRQNVTHDMKGDHCQRQ